MKRSLQMLCALVLAISPVVGLQAAEPQQAFNPQPLIAAQKDAMAPLSFMDGTWRGEARTTGMDGKQHVVSQTERVGPLLDGAIKLIEGRGYMADGSTAFNAFAVLSWDVQKQAYNFRSHAMGHAGDFKFNRTDDGFAWEIPAGPMTMRYTATIKDGTWHEVGERIIEGQPPVRFFEMTLKRIGDSDWPTAGAVPRNGSTTQL